MGVRKDDTREKRQRARQQTMNTDIFEVYTYFGRVLYKFPIEAGQTHHDALEEARLYISEAEKQGTTCWLRLTTI